MEKLVDEGERTRDQVQQVPAQNKSLNLPLPQEVKFKVRFASPLDFS